MWIIFLARYEDYHIIVNDIKGDNELLTNWDEITNQNLLSFCNVQILQYLKFYKKKYFATATAAIAYAVVVTIIIIHLTIYWKSKIMFISQQGILPSPATVNESIRIHSGGHKNRTTLISI